MKKDYYAFTLTEMLVALGIVAVLCAILLPMVHNVLPNKNVIMAKRAYYTTQTIVSEMINDEGCYPNKEDDPDVSRRRVGFGDGYGYEGCLKWGGSENTAYLTKEDRMKKFSTLFFDKLGVEPPSSYSKGVTTDDGMTWVLDDRTTYGPSDGFYLLYVDVNGDDNGSNCTSAPVSDIDANSYRVVRLSACSSGSNNYDQFAVAIYVNGKITILSDWAAEAADISSGITK